MCIRDSNSPALSHAVSPCPANDARAIPRPQGTGCDAGAYERVAQLSLQPTFVFAGSEAILLKVVGEGFADSDQIVWDGMPYITQYVDSATLTALIPANELISPREVLVQVSNSSLPVVRFRVLKLNAVSYTHLDVYKRQGLWPDW